MIYVANDYEETDGTYVYCNYESKTKIYFGKQY